MEGTKSPFASKTVWGGIISIGSVVAGAVWGFDVDAGEQARLAESLAAAGVAVGTALSIFGRIRARKKIGRGSH